MPSSEKNWPVEHEKAGDGEEKEEPEPEGDVDLVVDHVDGQHAQTVVSRRNCR